MKNISTGSIGHVPESDIVTLPENMLRAELDLMVRDEIYLKKIVGAAVLLVTRLDRCSLPGGAALAAFTLAGLIEGMPKELMSDALSLFQSL